MGRRMSEPWLTVHRGHSPLVVSMPHTGTDIPHELEARFVSSWLARKDADWWIDKLYGFAQAMGATTVRTSISRSVIDVNRDPTGKSLYPGRNTTELCPTTTFDGEPLYREGGPDGDEIAARRRQYFEPYHGALTAEIARLRGNHERVVLFDAHSIRSRISRLFDGELPNFNIGTNGGASCAGELTRAVEAVCADSPFSRVTDGRFKGGYTTRHYGDPISGVHAIQLELADRGYMDEPGIPSPANWPPPYSPARAEPLRSALKRTLEACLKFAGERS